MDAREFEDDALALADAEVVSTWGHPTFRVGGRIFASLPEPGVAVVKTTPEEQEALVASGDGTYAPAPRVGRFGWVCVRLTEADRAQVRELLTEAWRRTTSRSRTVPEAS